MHVFLGIWLLFCKRLCFFAEIKTASKPIAYTIMQYNIRLYTKKQSEKIVITRIKYYIHCTVGRPSAFSRRIRAKKCDSLFLKSSAGTGIKSKKIKSLKKNKKKQLIHSYIIYVQSCKHCICVVQHITSSLCIF